MQCHFPKLASAMCASFLNDCHHGIFSALVAPHVREKILGLFITTADVHVSVILYYSSNIESKKIFTQLNMTGKKY